MKTTIVPNILRRAPLVIPMLVVCFWLQNGAQAVNPPPDGGYPGANTAEGTSALFSLTTGNNNTALGSEALSHLQNGNQNTAVGVQALKDNYHPVGNTAVGFQTLSRNNNGIQNTATGWRALFTNTAGSGNTADGYGALYSNTVGSENTAGGFQALYRNSSGSRNTAYGYQANFGGGHQNTALGAFALASGTSSDANTAVGSGALFGNTTGSSNTATGLGALQTNSTGNNNTANGVNALNAFRLGFSPGSNNTAVGAYALVGADGGGFESNTAIGAQALSPHFDYGQNNIAIGFRAGSNFSFGDYDIEIGNQGGFGDEGGYTIRIGDVQMRTFVAGIYNVNEGGTILPVYINSDGQLGTQPPASARRFKNHIKPMDNTSESILALKPVTFQYKSDKTNTAQFGLIAEQVAEVNRDLVVRDNNGEIYTVRYEAVNAMLLNEFLKEHRKAKEQGGELRKQAAMIAQQHRQIEALTAGLQKVSARFEVDTDTQNVVAAHP